MTAEAVRSRRPAAASTFFVAVTLALLVAMLVAVAVGTVSIPLGDAAAVIARRLGLIDGAGVTQRQDQIIWQLRLPRVIGAAAAGAGLALCGAVLQSLTRNELADPYLLGVSSGATVGAVSVIVLGLGVSWLSTSAALSIAAFVGALAALALVLMLATDRAGSLPPARTILAGVAVAQVCAAATSFAIIVSEQPDAARRVLSWTLGSFAGVRWSDAVVLLVAAGLTCLFLLWMARDLDAFAFGETSATSLGVDVRRTRWILLVATSLIVALLVANVGTIGFIGLVVPHIVRLVLGPSHLRMLPSVAVVGALLAVCSDLVARILVQDVELPVGVITALVGAPVFAILLRRQL